MAIYKLNLRYLPITGSFPYLEPFTMQREGLQSPGHLTYPVNTQQLTFDTIYGTGQARQVGNKLNLYVGEQEELTV